MTSRGIFSALQPGMAAIVLALAVLFGDGLTANAQRPNIVFIMVDDMGYGELGVTGQLQRAANGQNAIETPNLDLLAINGLRMTEFYATPICASTRSAVLTGYHNGHSSVDRNGGNNGGNAMRAVDITMAESLKSAGYRTGIYGKWGLGGFDHTVAGVNVHNSNTAIITHPEAIPTAQGFDEFYGYLNQVRAHDYYETFQWEHDGLGGVRVHNTSTSDYSHDLIAERSLDFVSDHADPSGANPFFLYAPYTIPHGNFDPPNDAILQDFLARGYSNDQAVYAAMMKRLDNSVGDIVSRLQDPNQDGNSADSVYDDTLLVFATDNGGLSSKNALFDGDAGFRGAKGSVHEGGTRSPLIASWQGTIAPGQVDTTNVAALDDLFATFADLADADTSVGLDSASIAGLFDGGAVEDRQVHAFEARVHGDWAVRVGDWKLSKTGSDVLGLYNLNTDPFETTDLKANPQYQAIATLLEQIAFDEGLEADAGNSASQTTNIVQYKSWEPSASTDWNDPALWTGGTQFNSRGTAVNNFNTGPAANWVATVNNNLGGSREALVNSSSEVLGLHVLGEQGAMSIQVNAGVTLTARNGVRIEGGGKVTLLNGNLGTMRTVDIRPGGMLAGAGNIGTMYDTTDTPFDLKSTVRNAGRLDLGSDDLTGGTTNVELAQNGGFELGSGNTFSQTIGWFNHGGDDSRNARNTTNPQTGAYRGIIGVSGGGIPVSPGQNTGHTIGLGDEYTLQFGFAGASGWTAGTDGFIVAAYYTDNGSPVDLFGATVIPSQNFGSGYDMFSLALPAVTDANAVGKPLQLRFESLVGANKFASIDGVSLTIQQTTTASSILAIDGDYYQEDNGSIGVDILGVGQVAGIDFEQLAVTGFADLDGGLELSVNDGVLLEGYRPLDFIVAEEGVVGRFDEIDGIELDSAIGLAVTYDTHSVRVQAALLGDANLDGNVDVADFNIWNSHKFQDGQTWSQGDFNGDGFTDASDFNSWNSNKFTSVGSRLVPEPTSALLVGLILPSCVGLIRRARLA